MPEVKPNWWDDEPAPKPHKLFYGLSFSAYRALSHPDRMALMAKHDRLRGIKPLERCDPVYGVKWTVLQPTKRPKK